MPLFKQLFNYWIGVPIMRSMNLRVSFDPACDYFGFAIHVRWQFYWWHLSLMKTGDVYYYLQRATGLTYWLIRWLVVVVGLKKIMTLLSYLNGSTNSLLGNWQCKWPTEYDYGKSSYLHLFQLARKSDATCQVLWTHRVKLDLSCDRNW